MKITKQLLKEKAACADGVTAFVKAFPRGFNSTKWTLEKQLETLHDAELRKYIGWAYYNGLIPLWSMQSADLQSADLQSANLRWANLRSANLQSARYSQQTIFPADFDPKTAGGWLVE